MPKLVVKQSQQRVDKYLALNTDYSRSIITKMFAVDKIKVNNKLVKASYQVTAGDQIDYPADFIVPPNIEPENIPLDIIYEDAYLIVLNKPSGLVVHPGNGVKNGTLVNALMHYTNNLSDVDPLRCGIVHRLDKNTSGLMLVAKNNQVHNLLTAAFQNKTIKRTYIALLNGVLPHESATIDAPIGRDQTNRERMIVTATNSKKAISHLKVLTRYDQYTLVNFILETGRTHQIRVHAKYIGYPVYNDPLYSHAHDAFGQFLHSVKLAFTHPITKESLSFECSLPEPFDEYLKKL